MKDHLEAYHGAIRATDAFVTKVGQGFHRNAEVCQRSPFRRASLARRKLVSFDVGELEDSLSKCGDDC